MDEHTFLTALRTYWQAAWPPVPYDVPSYWADDPNTVDTDTAFLRVTIRTEGARRRGIGRAREEARGLVMVEVWTPRSEGPGVGERLGSAAAALWRAFRHAYIILDAPSVVGLTADGAFNRHLVTLGWRGDMRFAA